MGTGLKFFCNKLNDLDCYNMY